jgi:hypothetical protein
MGAMKGKQRHYARKLGSQSRQNCAQVPIVTESLDSCWTMLPNLDTGTNFNRSLSPSTCSYKMQKKFYCVSQMTIKEQNGTISHLGKSRCSSRNQRWIKHWFKLHLIYYICIRYRLGVS